MFGLLFKIFFLAQLVNFEPNEAARADINAFHATGDIQLLCNLNEPYFRDFCQNRGTCLIRLKKEDYALLAKSWFVLLPKLMRNQAYCSCLSGFAGSKCEINENGTIINTNSNSAPPATRGSAVKRSLSQLDELKIERDLKACNNVASCDKQCQFGYKLDYRTDCALCECVDLELSECGVPCYMKNTQTCQFSNRANSRPTCVCRPEFQGAFCEKYKGVYNFTARIENTTSINNMSSDQIKTGIADEISRLLNIGMRQVVVYDLEANLSDLIVKAHLYPTDFSSSIEFKDLTEYLDKILSDKQTSLNLKNQTFKLSEDCSKTEALFSVNLANSKKISKENILTKLITHYGFKKESISLAKNKSNAVNIKIKKTAKENSFCTRVVILQKDINSGRFFPVRSGADATHAVPELA